jgi:hypothetical protein
VKIVRIETLIEAGSFPRSPECERIRTQVLEAIRMVVWPPNSGAFTLYDEPGKERGSGNGVKPIKTACMQHLEAQGWVLEPPLDIATVSPAGANGRGSASGEPLFLR